MRPKAEIESAVHRRVAQGSHPGFVIGLWRNGEVETIAHGIADVIGGGPMTRDLLFELGSITKVFTGILLAAMADGGEVDVEEPVGRFLEGCVELRPAFAEQVTLLDLVTHHSGLPVMPAEFDGIEHDGPQPFYPRESFYKLLREFEPPVERGGLYSNVAFGLLGHCLSLRAGLPLATLMLERIFQPLGMTATGYDRPKVGLARGHGPAGNRRPAWDITETMHGAGGLRGPVADLLRLVQACLEEPGGCVVRRAVHTSLRPVRHYHGGSDIGLGWEINGDFPPDCFAYKGGSTTGFTTCVLLAPERNEAVVVLSNASQGIRDLAYYAIDSRFGLYPHGCWDPPFIAPPKWFDSAANPCRRDAPV
ncbi:MAG TPA: serine hydrolase domain-containing protein [Azospirillaceae bacterium]|nr:serine hydrolase domain-containing protein [Azospirillaceae bacterium]